MAQRHKLALRMRFAFAAWLSLLVAVSLFPVSFKLKLHTTGPMHDYGHYLAFLVTAVFLWLMAERPLGRIVGFFGGVLFSYSQEWAENRIYHAGFEWKDVGTDFAGLVSGFVFMILVSTLLMDDRPRARY